MPKNKKTQKRKKSFSPIKFLIVMAVFVVAVALIIEFVDFKAIFNGFKQPENSQSATDSKKSEAKEDIPNPHSENTNPDQLSKDKEKKVPQYEGEDPNKSNDITGIISHSSVSNNKLILRVTIDQYLNSGTCVLKMTHQDGNSYQSTANVAESASTSTCEGFDVPTSALKSGKWSIVITISSNGKSGTISGEVKL